MADFCMQCSVGLGAPEGWSDFADPSLREGDLNVALCEGCGMAWTNAAGECVSDACLCRHGDGQRPIPAEALGGAHEEGE